MSLLVVIFAATATSVTLVAIIKLLLLGQINNVMLDLKRACF